MNKRGKPDLLTRNWLPYQTNLICLVKKYPITYDASPTKRYQLFDKTRWDTAWSEISAKLGQPCKTCKQEWTKIKFRYAKLTNLTNDGKTTKDKVMSYPETRKYFDGSLSFMDPFIDKITDANIPFRIHKSINDILGLHTKQATRHVTCKERNPQFVSHAQVKALLKERQWEEGYNLDVSETLYLQTVVDSAVKLKLEELRNNTINTNNVPMTPNENVHKKKPNFTLIPSKNIQNNDEGNTAKTVDLGLETELIIEDDIKSEVEDDNMEMEDDNDLNVDNLTLEKNIYNTTDENDDLVNVMPSTQSIMAAVCDPMKNTIGSLNNDVIRYKTDNVEMMDTNEHPITDEYIRNFFNELGVVMSMELSISKQKILRSRINELLKDLILKEEGHRYVKVRGRK